MKVKESNFIALFLAFAKMFHCRSASGHWWNGREPRNCHYCSACNCCLPASRLLASSPLCSLTVSSAAKLDPWAERTKRALWVQTCVLGHKLWDLRTASCVETRLPFRRSPYRSPSVRGFAGWFQKNPYTLHAFRDRPESILPLDLCRPFAFLSMGC